MTPYDPMDDGLLGALCTLAGIAAVVAFNLLLAVGDGLVKAADALHEAEAVVEVVAMFGGW